MSEKHDEDLLKRGAVKKAVIDAPTYVAYGEDGSMDDGYVLPDQILDAIDKLPAVSQVKDCVGREEALCQIENLTSTECGGASFFSRVQIRNVIAKLPTVLPAIDIKPRPIRGKSPEQIERAIKYFEKAHTEARKTGYSGALHLPTPISKFADLLRCVLNQKQTVWDEEQIFGKPNGKVE